MSSHITMSNSDGASTLTKSDGPKLDPAGHDGWQGFSIEASGVFMFMFDISPDAVEFPIHASEDEWLAYIVSGSGTLFAGTADMEKSEGMPYTAGDFVTFERDTPHGWINDGEPSRILFTKQA